MIAPRVARGPFRTCFVTRRTLLKDTLIRFVFSSDGMLLPDVLGTRPGRGAWVTAERRSVLKAIEKNLFSKVFKRKIIVSESLPDQIDSLFEQNALHLFQRATMARKVYKGSAAIRARAKERPPFALICSTDAALDETEALFAALSRKDFCFLRAFLGYQFSVTPEAEIFHHVSLEDAMITRRFLSATQRWMAYRQAG